MKHTILLLLLSLAPLTATEPPMVGTFRIAQKTGFKSERLCLEVTINADSHGYLLTGTAGFSSGRSPASDFEGSAIPQKATSFQFDFEDSFGNKGTAFVTPQKGNILFSAKLTEVKDPRCLPLYEQVLLKRVKGGSKKEPYPRYE